MRLEPTEAQAIEDFHRAAARYCAFVESDPSDPAAEMRLLARLLAELRNGSTLADDTAGQAESEAWEAFLAYYGTLSGMAKHQPALATELGPVIEFMATGPRKKGTAPAPSGGGGGNG